MTPLVVAKTGKPGVETKAEARSKSAQIEKRLFRPIIHPSLLSQLRELVSQGKELGSEATAGRLRSAGLDPASTQDEVAYNAACLVLADVVEQGWEARVDGEGIALVPPATTPAAGEDPREAKERVRRGLMTWRDRQLALPSTREFLRHMQEERVVAGRAISVLDLVDDGKWLADELTRIRHLPPSEREAALAQVIRPVVQVCEPGTRCSETGQFLMDIWRFFRHTWALEYRSVPGRSMALLIRNAARPHAPVIGIAMLASPAVRLWVRDAWIGWYLEGLEERITKGVWARAEVASALIRSIEAALGDIRTDDLVSADELLDPTEPTILRIEQIAAGAGSERISRLQQLERKFGAEAGRHKRQKPQTADGNVDWKAASEQPLFLSKRAGTVARLLRARRAFALADIVGRPEWGLDTLLGTPTGRVAVSTALMEIRKRALASQVADVSVCGAIAPYNELLGGKLVALVLASREVRDAYRTRYSGQVSEIASQVAGRPVRRSGELMLLTTTSLYAAGSSQYNRLHLRAAEHPEMPADVRWVLLGATEGYGTVHLGRATVEALRALAQKVHGARRVNNVFGEGASPRMRQIREGLDALGVESDRVLNHASPRIVYGCELIPGARDELVGVRARGSHYEAPTVDELAAGWRRRWLARRIQQDAVLERVRSLGPRSLSQQLGMVRAGQEVLPLD